MSVCVLASAQLQLFTTGKSVRAQSIDLHQLTVDSDILETLFFAKHAELQLLIPIANKGIKKLILSRSTFLSPDLILQEKHNNGHRKIPQLDVIHYHGQVSGAKSSMVAITISKNQIIGVISFEQQNWNLQKDMNSGKYVLYSDDNINIPDIKFCESDEPHSEISHSQQINTNNNIDADSKKLNNSVSSVDVYIECDYQMFTDFGSDVDSTLTYAMSLLNTVNVLFNMSDINLNITQIDIWTTPDPYDANSADRSGDVLNVFKCELDGLYNGRIAHLLSTTNQFGGIANRRDYCPYEEPLYGFSRIFTSYNTNLNLYSWSVNVIAHEIGHNLSSPHTHNCSWNGNSTQIDDCANVHSTSNDSDSDCDGVIDNIEEAAGSDCFDILNPIIPAKGTIMSYCHISSGNGVDLSLGFHPQVGIKMKNYIDNCLSQSTVIYCPMPQLSDIQISSAGPNEMILTCNLINGIDGYAWYIKPDIPCAEDTTITTTTSTISYLNAFSGTSYIVKCLLNCDSGPEWGEWSCEKTYKTPCFDTLSLEGLVTNLVAIEGARDFIHSKQYIYNNSDVVYQIGTEAIFREGFEVELASIFEVVLNVCN